MDTIAVGQYWYFNMAEELTGIKVAKVKPSEITCSMSIDGEVFLEGPKPELANHPWWRYRWTVPDKPGRLCAMFKARGCIPLFLSVYVVDKQMSEPILPTF